MTVITTSTGSVTAEYLLAELERLQREYLRAVQDQQIEPSLNIARLAQQIANEHIGRAERNRELAEVNARYEADLRRLSHTGDSGSIRGPRARTRV